MKTITLFGFLFSCFILLFSCNSQSKQKKINIQTSDNSRSSLDWDGIYRGILPCADCAGIQTTIYLNKNLTYRFKLKYLNRDTVAKEYAGIFTWNEQGSAITLKNADNTQWTQTYLVGEKILTQLDKDGNKITGDLASNYILSKDNYALLEKYWKLVELNGKPVAVDSSFVKEPHIIFKEQDSRFVGNGGCNNFSGRYELKSVNRIALSNAISTKMACPHMELETQFLQALNAADNFTIANDMLSLNKAKLAPLARFKTVYMK